MQLLNILDNPDNILAIKKGPQPPIKMYEKDIFYFRPFPDNSIIGNNIDYSIDSSTAE
jgi:hypothetical protein